jgi:antitoxin ParD1/3/4
MPSCGMATLNVNLPEPLKTWVEAQAKNAGYDDPGDYLRELIRQEQDRANKIAAMQERVTEGLNSGLGQRSMAELRDAARARIYPTRP